LGEFENFPIHRAGRDDLKGLQRVIFGCFVTLDPGFWNFPEKVVMSTTLVECSKAKR